MMAIRLGYRTKRPEDGTGGPDDVEAINPEVQHDFEEMMLSMIADPCHEDAPSSGYEEAGEKSVFRLGYRTKRPEDGTGGPDDVEAINPEIQHDFEEMMLSMIAAP